MKVLVDSPTKSKSLEFTLKDFAIASLVLNEKVTSLSLFTNRCSIIEENDFIKLMGTETILVTQEFIQFKNGKVVFIIDNNPDWREILFMYTVYNSADKINIKDSVKNFIQNHIQEIISYEISCNEYRREITKSYKTFWKQFNFFNCRKMLKEFEKLNIEAVEHKGKIMVTLKNIRMGNEEEGFLTYNTIHLFIKDFQLDGYMLRFDHFDYNSYWNIPVRLHPHLLPPYGWNEALKFLPVNDYKLFAGGLISLATDYNNSGVMRSIINDFQELRLLWNTNKDRYNERVELSKKVLSNKVELNAVEKKNDTENNFL